MLIVGKGSGPHGVVVPVIYRRSSAALYSSKSGNSLKFSYRKFGSDSVGWSKMSELGSIGLGLMGIISGRGQRASHVSQVGCCQSVGKGLVWPIGSYAPVLVFVSWGSFPGVR